MSIIVKVIEKTRDKEYLNQLLNHLFIVYLFLFPISTAHKSVFVAILLVFLVRGDLKRHLAYALSNPVIQALALFGLLHILWMFVSEDMTYTVRIIRSAKYYFYPIIFMTFLDYRYISRYLSTFFLSMLYSELFSYGLYFQLIPIEFGFYDNAADPSPFYHHTHYGMALAFTLSIIFYKLFTHKENRLVSLLLSLFFITASINLFINGARTGYILYIILLVTMGLWFVRSYSYRLFAIIGPLVIITLFLAYNFSSTFQERLKYTQYEFTSLIKKQNYDSSFGARVGTWKHTIPVIKENPIFGVGTGNQLIEVKRQIQEHEPDFYRYFVHYRIVHLHNQYLSVLVQFGLIGLGIYLLLLYRLLTYRQDNDLLKTIQVFLTLSVIFFGFIDILTEGSALAILLFTSIIPITLLNSQDTPLKDTYEIKKVTFLYYALAIITFYLISRVT